MLEVWTKLITKNYSFSLYFKALFTLFENGIKTLGKWSVLLDDFWNHIHHIHNLGLKYAEKEKEKKKSVREGENIHLFWLWKYMCPVVLFP